VSECDVKRISRHARHAAALIWMILVLLTPTVALASGTSTCQGYHPQLCSSLESSSAGIGHSSHSPTSASTGGTLPFTGLDVVLLVSGAVGLLGAGAVMRRLSRRLG